MIELSSEFSIESLSVARKWCHKSHRLWSVGVPLVGWFMAATGIYFVPKSAYWPLGLVLVVVGTVVVFRFRLRGFFFRRSLRQNPSYGQTVQWSITDEGLSGKTSLSQWEMKWSAVYRAISTPEGVLLFPQKRLYYWLPREAFRSEEDYQWLQAILTARTDCKVVS